MAMTAMRNKVMATLLALVMVVAVAACGGGGDDPVVESSGNDSPTTEATDDSGSDSDDGGSSGDLDNALGMFGDDECTNVGLAYATISLGALGSMFGGAMEDEELQEMEDELAGLGAEIPDEIADDFEVIQDAFAEFGEALGEGGGNIFDPEYQEKMEEAGAALESDEVTEAQANIEEWLAENCEGFDASDFGS
ncbi:hypothetical protein [Rhabdothermincola salaria]|uniref:hypothetical protein n=1 Tax=Rhabdothermincola salaria TaxID=2903142 RepID=UPI001E3279A9|nr:hypothetical protein [Rhabdothermincola salaria]MCD9623723.1 hypothetical protein [Rhabdothermincola salaria]